MKREEKAMNYDNNNNNNNNKTLYTFLLSLLSTGGYSFSLFLSGWCLSSYASGQKDRRVGAISVQPRVFRLPLTTLAGRVPLRH
jgi:hypothetical protein